MCRVGVSKKAAEYNFVFMNRGTEGTCGHRSLIKTQRSCERERRVETREWAGERSPCIRRGTSHFSSLKLWSAGIKRGRLSSREKLLDRPLPHPGHLFLRCRFSCQWQMTQHQLGGSRRQCLGAHSPEGQSFPGPRPSSRTSSNPFSINSIHWFYFSVFVF